jgi:hypothetical protein
VRQQDRNPAEGPGMPNEEKTVSSTSGTKKSANRRRALTLGGAAAAALAGSAMSAGKANAHGTQGDITSNTSDPAIHGINTSVGPAIMGENTYGGGPGAVFGHSAGLPPGVRGDSDNGFGVEGKGLLGGLYGMADGFNREAVRGYAPKGKGIVGISDELTGVSGVGPEGVRGHGIDVGVHGFGSDVGVGVHGVGRTGVKAEVTGALADVGFGLEVVGKAKFSTAGAGNIPKGTSSATVANPAVTANSHITVTLTGNPGRAQVRWVNRQPGTGFVVHLNRKAQKATPFTFLIVEP